jgi:hypothetical protein
VPVKPTVGVGDPVTVTGKEPAVPIANVVLVEVVKAGGWLIVSVKLCVAMAPSAF